MPPTPPPSSGPETLRLALRKPTGQANSTYEYPPVGSMLLGYAGNSQPLNFLPRSPLPTFSSDGSLAGTFAGDGLATSPSGTGAVVRSSKAGPYANVQP